MQPAHLLAARPAPAYLHTIRRYLGTLNRQKVGHVGKPHSLMFEDASTSGAGVPGHWHVYNRLGDLFGRRRLAVAEQSHTRLAARTLGLAAAPALGERRSLSLSRSLGLGEFLMQLFVGCRQPSVLLLKPRHQRDKLIPFRGGQAWGTAHSQSLNQHPALAATPLRATKPLINYWTAFPSSDYYGGSVAIGLASRRQSRIPCAWNVIAQFSRNYPYQAA